MGLTHLPPATVRLLASSQVITSVSSVVKELMENSFDAGASNIEVRLEKHGLEKIEVKDDGYGVTAEDCLCMALPHYTSKISDFSDLDKVQSFGFRGEALYSLCTLASVTVTTRTADDEMARSYTFDNTGNVIESKISHGLKGTSVVVTGLFKNVPVRRTVMSTGKRVGEELKKVENIVKSLAVIHPRVRVSLAHNKFLIWQKTSVAHLKLSVMQILNHTITRQLYHLVHCMDKIKIELLIPKKDCDIQIVSIASVVDSFRLFINKRPVRDKKIEKVFSDVFFSYFGHYMPTNKFPVCFVAISIPPGMLDINLEPNKTKVFIKDQDDILQCLEEQLSLYYCDSFEENQVVENCKNNHKKRKAEASPNKAESKTLKSPLKALKSNQLDLPANKPYHCASFTNDLQQKQIEINAGFSDNNNEDVIDEKSSDKLFGEPTLNELEIFPENIDGIVSNLNESNNLSGTSSDASLFGKSSESLTISVDPGITIDCQSVSSGDMSQLNSQKSSDSLPMSLESSPSVSTVSEKSDSDKEISLSQWSRGNISFNENKVQGSSVLIKPSSVSNEQNNNLSDGCNQNGVVNNADELSKRSRNLMDELDKFFESEEGNLLLENVTKNDKVHISSENSNSVSDENILLPKKPENQNSLFKITKTEETNSNNNDSLNRSVSSQMGKKELSAFTKFAREMRSEILKESPGMSFTLVASTLASKWRNLQTAEKEKYEKISVEEKAKKKEPVKMLNKTLSPKKPDNIIRPSIQVNVEMKFDLERYFDRLCESSHRDNTVEIIGQIESSDLWMYSRVLSDTNRTEIGVLSILRLQEAYRFYQNMEMISIPVKNLEKSIRVTESDLGSDLWDILMNLESSFDEKTNSKSINDDRIVMNGFRISIIEDERGDVAALLTDVAMNINFYGVEDLRHTLQVIKSDGKDCSVARSRCLNAAKFIRSETIRQCSLLETSFPDKSEVTKLTNLWWNECQNYNKCPHGKDIILPLQNLQY